MLNTRVRRLWIKVWIRDLYTFDLSLLSDYDGEGRCEEIDIDTKEGNTFQEIKESLGAWGRSKGWKVNIGYSYVFITRA